MSKTHQPESWCAARRGLPGRREYVFTNTEQLLPEGASALRAHARAGVGNEQALSALMLRFKGAQRKGDPNEAWPAEVVALDAALDRSIGNFHDLVLTLERVLADSADGKLWTALREAVLPQGAAYYTSQPYIEEAARVGTLLAELGKATFAPLTSQPLVGATIASIATLHAPYAQAVGKFHTADKVTWNQIKDLDLANHRHLCQLIDGIQWELRGDEPARKRALGPAIHQDEAIYELLRRKTKLTDIDPATGDPVDDAPTPVNT